MTGRPRLSVDFTVSRPAFPVRVGFEVAPGETLAVLGPNGAGKSTVLAVIAGLLEPDVGTVTVDGRTLTERNAAVRASVPPELRRIGVMRQDPMLFPHLDAVHNVAFGPRSQGCDRHRARALAAEWLQRMGIAELGRRRPAELSGGQRQRVALARALAAEPDVLLLDEPLGALDVRTAPEIRHVLRTHLRDAAVTSVLVTHDVLDAAVLADRVVVLERGQIVDCGPTSTVLISPRSVFGAAMAGVNLQTGVAAEAVPAGRPARLRSDDGFEFTGLAADDLAAGEPVAAIFAPAAVAVFAQPVTGSPRNHWSGLITGMETGVATVRVRIARITSGATAPTPGGPEVTADLTPAAVAELRLTLGGQVFVMVKATEVRVHSR